MASLYNWRYGTQRESIYLISVAGSNCRIPPTVARKNMRYIHLISMLNTALTSLQRLRPLSYSKSHVILIAFSVDTPDSLENVTVKVRPSRPEPLSTEQLTNSLSQWIEEVREICGPDIPVILVGCKTDLRPSPNSPNSDNFVSYEKGKRVAAEIGARAYKECSALKSEGVDDVFEAATRASMLMREGTKYHDQRNDDEEDEKGKCCIIC